MVYLSRWDTAYLHDRPQTKKPEASLPPANIYCRLSVRPVADCGAYSMSKKSFMRLLAIPRSVIACSFGR